MLVAQIMLCCMISACGHSRVYVPNAHHVPLVKEKGEVHLQLSGSRIMHDFPDWSIDLATAVNITGKLGAGLQMTSYDNPTSADENTYHKHSYSEFSAIVAPFEKRAGLHSEFMLNIGMGKGNERSSACKLGFACSAPDDIASGSYRKYSLQYNYAEEKRRFISGISLKVSYLNYYSLTTSADPTIRSSRGVFFEPAFFSRYGFSYAKLEFQTGMTQALRQTEKFKYSKYYASIGVQIHIGGAKR